MSMVKRECRWCSRAIVYDPGVKMWYAVPPHGGYYCSQDRDSLRCQHVPKKKESPK
jgi:hypothetical protein